MNTFNSGAEGRSLGSADVPVSPGDCSPLPCSYTIASLTQGQTYYTRIYSYNKFGFSVRAATTTPSLRSQELQALPPSYVTVVPASDTSLTVSFDSSPDNGGSPVTKYKLEWDVVHEAAVLASASADTNGILYSLNEVQRIETSATGNNLGGTFMVSFEGHSTSALPFDISANDMKDALEKMPTIGNVEVIRYPVDPTHPSNGLRWVITF